MAGKDAAAGGDDKQTLDPDRFQDPDNEVMTSCKKQLTWKTGLFASLPYDADDAEADKIYQDVRYYFIYNDFKIEDKMDERRKSRREQKEKLDRENSRSDNPKIQVSIDLIIINNRNNLLTWNEVLVR